MVKEAKASKPDDDIGKDSKKKMSKEELEESMRKMRLAAKLFTVDQMPEAEIKKAEATLAEMKEFQGKSAPEIGR